MSIPRAGFWIRFAATLIDCVAAIILYAVVGGVVYARTETERFGSAAGIAAFLLYTTTEVFLSATPGKLLLGLGIRCQDASPADRWRLSLRWSTKQFAPICQILWCLTRFPAFYLVGGFSGLVVVAGCFFASNDDKLTWHDQWAGTAVFRKRVLDAKGA